MRGAESAIVQLLQYAGNLKRLPRQGWLHLEVPEPESVADHSFRVALMTLLLAHENPEIDVGRALTLALCHDLPEALAGDITPFDEALADEATDREQLFHSAPRYSPEADRAKREAEEKALYQMIRELPDSLSSLVADAWQEYEDGHSAEARLVRQVDKLEALLQAYEYRAAIPDLPTESFRLGAEERVRDEVLRRVLRVIVTLDSASNDELSR